MPVVANSQVQVVDVYAMGKTLGVVVLMNGRYFQGHLQLDFEPIPGNATMGAYSREKLAALMCVKIPSRLVHAKETRCRDVLLTLLLENPDLQFGQACDAWLKDGNLVDYRPHPDKELYESEKLISRVWRDVEEALHA